MEIKTQGLEMQLNGLGSSGGIKAFELSGMCDESKKFKYNPQGA